MKHALTLAITLPLLLTASPASATHVFINEIHYDNAGGDVGEFVEIAGPAGTDLTGWSIVRYNGSNGQAYTYSATSDVLGLLPNQSSGYGFAIMNYPTDGLQNGSPDGIALVDNSGAVIQFLSYEGSFVAADGPAAGLTSTDIGVSEDSSTPVDFSLQLTGTGSLYEDFTWAAPQTKKPGTVNASQTFSVPDHGSTFSLLALGLLALPSAMKLRRN